MRKQMAALIALSISTTAITQISVSAWAEQPVSSANISNLKQGMKVGGVYYVNVDNLNLRSKDNSLVGSLTRGDKVEILDLGSNSSMMVKINILNSLSAENSSSMELFVSAQYLSATPTTAVTGDASKYILVQNVATEKARVYERCTTSPGCPHRLVMEEEMVVGRNETIDSTTWLGRFKITAWYKFYQDHGDLYPSWYDPNYPALPGPGASVADWTSKALLPNGQGNNRGDFGWYTALTGPNSTAEWVHGTFGWGSDGNKFILATRKIFANMAGDQRSHGCTRLQNPAIAYLRHILPVGTELYRVYAQEAYRDPSRAAYANQKTPKAWDWILTKEGVRMDGPDADKALTLARGVPDSLVLERGTYKINQYPTAVPYKKNAGWISRVRGTSGNVYNIDDKDYHGVFLVDEGRFVNYAHPGSLPVGGFDNHALPNTMTTEGPYVLP